MRNGTSALLLALVVFAAPAEAARLPADGVLGLRLGMPKEAAVQRLGKIGHLTSEKGEVAATRQRWDLTDRGYAHLVVQFDPKRRLQWLSLFARPGGRAVRFADLGDLKAARKTGDYIYTWSMPARGGRDPYQVIARSRSPEILESLSLVRVNRPLNTRP